MDSADTPLRTALEDLRAAGTRVARGSDSATCDIVPEVLAQVEGTLRELSALCYGLGYVVVPRPRDAGSASHERKALALSTLHEVGASMGASARRCRAAMEAVAPLADSVVGGRAASPPLTGGRVAPE
jgi:hypothetical protein